jgi:hypothetical protein
MSSNHLRPVITHANTRATVVIADHDVEAGKKLEEEIRGYFHTKQGIFSPSLTLLGRYSSNATRLAGTTKSVFSKRPRRLPRPERSHSWSQMPVSTGKMKSLRMLAMTVRLLSQISLLST